MRAHPSHGVPVLIAGASDAEIFDACAIGFEAICDTVFAALLDTVFVALLAASVPAILRVFLRSWTMVLQLPWLLEN